MKWKISYYNETVEKEVSKLPKGIKAKYFAITDMMIDHGPDLGMPYTKAMGKSLFEIRAKGKEGIARAFFCSLAKKIIVILHVFIKKTEATPKKELEIARKRLKEVKEHDI